MYTRSVGWGVVIMAWFASTSMAQPPASPTSYPVEMTIVVPEVEVRSGPTRQHYPTSKMRQGERVTVVSDCKDQPEWVAIKPPVGSFSWIREKFVNKVDTRSGFVQAPANAVVSVMPGSSVVEQALNVESEKVPPGCQVVILDKPFHWQGENWLPIVPTPKEVRYIPRSALRAPAAAVAVASGFPTIVGGDPLTKAEQAYAAGDLDLACSYYRQAADTMAEPQKSVATKRLATLTTTGASPTYGQPHWQPIATGPPPLSTPAVTPSSASAPVAPATLTTSTYPLPSATMARQPPQWSGWGYLRRTPFVKDGQPVYVLENRQGQPLKYAVEQTSIGTAPKLQNMIGRLICLYGPITYRSEDYPRIEYMMATHIATP